MKELKKTIAGEYSRDLSVRVFAGQKRRLIFSLTVIAKGNSK
jgi:hypothetical protein